MSWSQRKRNAKVPAGVGSGAHAESEEWSRLRGLLARQGGGFGGGLWSALFQQGEEAGIAARAAFAPHLYRREPKGTEGEPKGTA